MSFIKNITLKQIFIILYSIFIFYLSFYKRIPASYSTILFIILGLLILMNKPNKYDSLFKSMNNDDLTRFKNCLSSLNLKVENIHNIFYKKTPIYYAIERKAFNIFKYLIENNYNLNFTSEKIQPLIIFASHSADVKFLELLLQYKNKFDLNVIDPFFGANALEVAVWRHKDQNVNALLNAGMVFSIQKYNNTYIGKTSPFENIPLKVKKVLAKKYVFNKTVKQLNMINEIEENSKIKSFDKIKIYWNEYLKFV